jgi:short-subunit dehydrogenase
MGGRVELQGKVALVTGASSGIGRAVAVRLAGAGSHVVVHGRDETRGAAVARSVRGTLLLGDLAASGVCEALAADATSSSGGVDVLVANAGVGWWGPLTAMEPARIDEIVSVDLLAPIRLTRALLPGMVERGSGHIVLVGSVAGTGVAGEAVYAACKAGLAAFADSVRLELHGTGIRVTVVVPAAVRSGFFTTRGHPYDRRIPRPVNEDAVAAAVIAAIRADRPEVWVPRWLRIAPVVRAAAPTAFRRLSARYGGKVTVSSAEERA